MTFHTKYSLINIIERLIFRQFYLYFLFQILQMVEHAISPIVAGVVQLTKEFGLGTFGPQMVLFVYFIKQLIQNTSLCLIIQS